MGSNDETKAPTYDEIRNMARRWYYDEIKSIADEVERKCKARDFDSSDEVHDYVQQTIDGHEFVIYTGQAMLACFASDHDDDYEEENGEKPPTVEVQAFYAIKRDVYETLDATVIDAVDEEPEDEESDEDDEVTP